MQGRVYSIFHGRVRSMHQPHHVSSHGIQNHLAFWFLLLHSISPIPTCLCFHNASFLSNKLWAMPLPHRMSINIVASLLFHRTLLKHWVRPHIGRVNLFHFSWQIEEVPCMSHATLLIPQKFSLLFPFHLPSHTRRLIAPAHFLFVLCHSALAIESKAHWLSIKNQLDILILPPLASHSSGLYLLL
jgi:hypothetical protein